jgi:hypothetical protein
MEDKNQKALCSSKLILKPEVKIANDFDITNEISIGDTVHSLPILENMVHETISAVCDMPRQT